MNYKLQKGTSSLQTRNAPQKLGDVGCRRPERGFPCARQRHRRQLRLLRSPRLPQEIYSQQDPVTVHREVGRCRVANPDQEEYPHQLLQGGRGPTTVPP